MFAQFDYKKIWWSGWKEKSPLEQAGQRMGEKKRAGSDCKRSGDKRD